MSLLEPVLVALHQEGVRYVIVGGVAVVLHGHPRMTADLDLAIDLSVGSPERAVSALSALGLVPRLPVEANDFADPDVRSRWVEERNLMVFTMWDPAEPLRQVDIFASDPMPFEGMWQRAIEVQLTSVIVRIASIPDRMTATAGPVPPTDEEGASIDWGWDRHGQDQRDAWSASTPAQRLAWLEDALRFACDAGALPA